MLAYVYTETITQHIDRLITLSAEKEGERRRTGEQKDSADGLGTVNFVFLSLGKLLRPQAGCSAIGQLDRSSKIKNTIMDSLQNLKEFKYEVHVTDCLCKMAAGVCWHLHLA